MAAEPNAPTKPQAQPPQTPTPPAPNPYEPTAEEQAYMQACAGAIMKGCEFCVSAEAASNADAYLKFANGVKSLTDAYEAIKNGGQPSRHQGA